MITPRMQFVVCFSTLLLLGALVVASRADAEWTQVPGVPNTTLNSLWVKGDTIAVGSDDTVYVSTNAGASFLPSAKVQPGAQEIREIMMRNGRLYAASRFQGMFISDDLGASWSSFNQGLTGGFANSQFDIIDMVNVGDNLYLATEGDGAWVRNLTSGTWQRFGEIFGPAQATNMSMIAAGNGRLLSGGGFNGTAFFRDAGDPDWTQTLMFNDRLAPGLAILTAIWTGARWVVGTNIGAFLSPNGDVPWTLSDPGAGHSLFTVSFAMHGPDLFANFGAFSSDFMVSHDQGESWELLDVVSVPITGLAVRGNTLFASRFDGLWTWPLANVASVPPPVRAPRLGFAIAGAQPVRDVVKFHFELPAAGRASIEVFDVTGRRVGPSVDGSFAAGLNEVAFDARALAPGVYHARLSAGAETRTARLVRVR